MCSFALSRVVYYERKAAEHVQPLVIARLACEGGILDPSEDICMRIYLNIARCFCFDEKSLKVQKPTHGHGAHRFMELNIADAASSTEGFSRSHEERSRTLIILA